MNGTLLVRRDLICRDYIISAGDDLRLELPPATGITLLQLLVLLSLTPTRYSRPVIETYESIVIANCSIIQSHVS